MGTTLSDDLHRLADSVIDLTNAIGVPSLAATGFRCPEDLRLSKRSRQRLHKMLQATMVYSMFSMGAAAGHLRAMGTLLAHSNVDSASVVALARCVVECAAQSRYVLDAAGTSDVDRLLAFEVHQTRAHDVSTRKLIKTGPAGLRRSSSAAGAEAEMDAIITSLRRDLRAFGFDVSEGLGSITNRRSGKKTPTKFGYEDAVTDLLVSVPGMYSQLAAVSHGEFWASHTRDDAAARASKTVISARVPDTFLQMGVRMAWYGCWFALSVLLSVVATPSADELLDGMLQRFGYLGTISIRTEAR